MNTLSSYSFSGKKALVRVDLNVPQDAHGHVTDDTRARAIIPTVRKILQDGGSVILMSHLGRPKGKVNPSMSLKPVGEHLSTLLGVPVEFAIDCVGPDAQAKAAALKPGQVLLLENLRFHPEEEAGDEAFSKALSELGDVYVNDAFGTAHRAHASTTIVAKFFPNDKLFGHLIGRELDSVGKVLGDPQRPMTAIVGGSKVSSKIEVLQNLIGKCDELIIGGGMANTFVKAQGGQTGASLVEQFRGPLAAGVVATLVAAFAIPLVRSEGGFEILSPEGLACFGLCGFTGWTIIQEFYRGVAVRRRARPQGVVDALIGLVTRARRRYGGYIVHLGVVLMFLGWAGNAYKLEKKIQLRPGEEYTLGAYTIRHDGLRASEDWQKEMITADLAVLRDGEVKDVLRPARWWYYQLPDQPTTEVSRYMTPGEDVYVSMQEVDMSSGWTQLSLFINPLVNWIWIGMGVMLAGAMVCVGTRKSEAGDDA